MARLHQLDPTTRYVRPLQRDSCRWRTSIPGETLCTPDKDTKTSSVQLRLLPDNSANVYCPEHQGSHDP